MATTWDGFERYKQRGLDARRAGQWDAARTYLLEAARSMLDLSKQAKTDSLTEARRAMAEKLLELAKDCEEARKTNRRPGVSAVKSSATGGDAGGEEKETDASSWLVKEKPEVRFADVAGLEEVKAEIKLKMLYPFQHPELAERFRIRGGGGVLFYGPPGTGKTLLAKATAGELDAAFFVVSPAELLSKWVGEAEQNVKKLFDAAAEEQRSVIFIDEIEALVPARRDEGGSSVMQRVVPQILQGVEGFAKKKGSAVLLMGATNVPWQLDPAMLRPGRFDEKIYIPLPDEPARRKMLDLYLANRPLGDDVDLDALAKRLEGYSGADIRYLCDRAAVIPFMQAVARGGEASIGDADEVITPRVIADVLADASPSVTPEMAQRFAAWEKAGETA